MLKTPRTKQVMMTNKAARTNNVLNLMEYTRNACIRPHLQVATNELN